jgi:adenine-specific DNA-methyltransferase
MQNLLEDLRLLLTKDQRFVVDGKLLKNKVIECALSLDAALIARLLQNDAIKRYFFQQVGKVLVFDKVKFQNFVSNKQFLPDSYTIFKNKIGLIAGDQFVADKKEVVLAWPYKDCVLEGGQTKEDQNCSEIFRNEVLAPAEIDRLLSPKVFSNFKRITKNDMIDVTELSDRENYIIKGNNLLILHSLSQIRAIKGKVKLIYIDPPYNTGKDSFCYNDSFNHSAWLTFIKNRIEIAKELLCHDGVIFISIDINEQAYMKVLCDEIFKRKNYVGEIIWETATDNNATQISIEHEYVLCYAKNKELLGKWQIKSDKANVIQQKYNALKKLHGDDTVLIEKSLRAWINSLKKSNHIDLSGVSHYCYVDDKGVFYPGNSANTKPGGYNFDIIHPITGKVCKKPKNGYRWPETTFRDAAENGDVLWGEDENSIPRIKKRLETATELLKGYFYEDNRKSTKELTSKMGAKVFDNPKSVNLLKKIIRFTTQENDIILDFFAGSGSTAEAVLAVNKEDRTNRRFILCEQMDYIEDVTKARVQKCLGNASFISTELAPLSANDRSKIKNTFNLQALREIWKNLKANNQYLFSVSPSDVDALMDNSNDTGIEDLKNILYDILDKNLLYIPLSELQDHTYGLSENDKIMCNVFYSKR